MCILDLNRGKFSSEVDADLTARRSHRLYGHPAFLFPYFVLFLIQLHEVQPFTIKLFNGLVLRDLVRTKERSLFQTVLCAL